MIPLLSTARGKCPLNPLLTDLESQCRNNATDGDALGWDHPLFSNVHSNPNALGQFWSNCVFIPVVIIVVTMAGFGMRPNAVDPEATRGSKVDGKDGKKDENDTEEFDGFSAAMA